MKANKITWLVVFDSNACKIFNYTRQGITLLQEIQHPENKLPDIELTSDKPGRYRMREQMPGGTYSQESNPKEIKIENFSREIAKFLEHARAVNEFTQLILIAPPHMIGLVNKHNSKQIEKLILHGIEKDFMHLPENELLSSVNSIIDNV